MSIVSSRVLFLVRSDAILLFLTSLDDILLLTLLKPIAESLDVGIGHSLYNTNTIDGTGRRNFLGRLHKLLQLYARSKADLYTTQTRE